MLKKNDTPECMSSRVHADKTAALLWDESFLWGVIACKALEKASLPFQIIRSGYIRDGRLDRHPFLFVPGGWSSNKMKALGEDGAEAVRVYVRRGGGYLGFCGGAGLATNDGIRLLDVRRRPTRQRVPSFSGRIRLDMKNHGIWNGVTEPVFHAWWPPQFDGCEETVMVLARYEKAMPDSFSSDLNVGDILSVGDWRRHEEVYGINLDPERLAGEPAVVSGESGAGKVILSLVHFDTPGDESGANVLRNLWEYLSGIRIAPERQAHKEETQGQPAPALALELEAAVSDLIELGVRNFIWFWRNRYLLQWRRGVRGLEYCTLLVMVREMVECLGRTALPGIDRDLRNLRDELIPFLHDAKTLLIMERIALQNGHITYDLCDDPQLQKKRERLFSSSKSYGGRFKEIIDMIDDILYRLLKAQGK
jgi:Biotin-protein ligase, N terminal